jgi:hypothetical protein
MGADPSPEDDEFIALDLKYTDDVVKVELTGAVFLSSETMPEYLQMT